VGQVIVGQLLNGAIVGTLYGILALGVTLTFSITGIVNFALGAFMMLGAYATWYLQSQYGLPFPVAVLGATVLVSVVGLICDRLLFRFTRNDLINGLLVSIGLIAVLDNLALMAFTHTPQTLDPPLSGSFNLFGIFLPKMKVAVFLVLATVVALTYMALRKTWFGRAADSYAQLPEAARLMGVRTELLQTGVFVYSIALAALGGGLYASLYSIDPSIGNLFVLKAVEAAILAGIGSVLGALAGGVILGVTENIGALYLPAAFRDAYGLVFLVLILLFKPNGLFAPRR
jgi:branched-chain amino acid transport system permease protein